MAYQKGDTISSADINLFLNEINTVYGTGTGNTGYGQTSLQGSVSPGSTVSSSHFANMRTMLVACANHQGTDISGLVPSSSLTPGSTVAAHETSTPTSNPYDINLYTGAIATNRLTAAPSSMTLSSTFSNTSTPTVTRSSNWTGTITCTIDVGFVSEDAARFFFNSGGQLRMSFVHPNGTANQDNDWRSVLVTKVGELRLGHNTVTITGTATTGLSGSPAGFYGLTTSSQVIYNGLNMGGTGYTANDVLINALVLNKVGANGGNGNTVRFIIQLKDDHTNAYYDSVRNGTAVSLSHYRATTYLTGIAAPSFTVQTSFG